jgi:hypothetical protein
MKSSIKNACRMFITKQAISGTNGSSGFGSHKSEQIDKSTGTKQKLVNVITPKPINTSY